MAIEVAQLRAKKILKLVFFDKMASTVMIPRSGNERDFPISSNYFLIFNDVEIRLECSSEQTYYGIRLIYAIRLIGQNLEPKKFTE